MINNKRVMKNFTSLLLFCFLPSALFAQHTHELKINEMFINNKDNLIDEYGRRVPWIEIFNTSTNDVNIADCYLTNDTTGLASKNMEDKAHWYRIPKGDSRTIIPPKGYLVFFLDNMPTYGTLHANFNPQDTCSCNYVALIHPNGHDLIHLFSFPEELRCSYKSYGYTVDYGPETFFRNGVELRNLAFLDFFSPGATNNFEPPPVVEKTKYAVLTVLFATLAIFTTLLLFLITLKSLGKWLTDLRLKLPKKKANHHEAEIAAALAFIEETKSKQNGGEEFASIAMALHLYFNTSRDQESEIITFDPSLPRYAPWAQKGLVMKRVIRK